MGHRTFWLLHSPQSTSKLAEWVHEEMESETVQCPVHEEHQRGGRRLTDLSISLPGSSVEDFIWTWYSECLMQDHVLSALRSKGFTGFEVKPVKAVFNTGAGRQPPRLWELLVNGWAGMAPVESGVRLVEHCDACGYRRYSGLSDPQKLISERQWDGSDFFMVWPLPAFIFITDRVANSIREAKWKGAHIMALSEIDASGFSPGRLSYWMPETRARQLGVPLGIY